MTNLTTEEMQDIKRIVDGANEGSESYGFLPSLNVHLDSGCDVPSGIRNIDDLRKILAQQQEIERLQAGLEFRDRQIDMALSHNSMSYLLANPPEGQLNGDYDE